MPFYGSISFALKHIVTLQPWEGFMRYLIAAATLALLAVPAHADTMKNCGVAWTAKAPTAATVAESICLIKPPRRAALE